MHLNVLLTEYNLHTTSAYYEHFQALPPYTEKEACVWLTRFRTVCSVLTAADYWTASVALFPRFALGQV